MENFKSFGRKLTVPFFPGFTAITGPNGSGKSNIADAILFVLGPKSSKTMRAGRLTDLIFNGGKKRKTPANHCKVSLVFDNTERKMPIDNDDVTLTKMIKRAPLKDNPDNYYSYYYINGKSSSYTEFSTVLQQARISGDGYNIVKQGDVTNIIEMGGVERRRLLDEIAGISTFDADLSKAEKEKDDVDTNLERIRIIVKEIDNQLHQLKHERDEAARYNELKQQLFEIKTKIAEKKKQEIQSQISEIVHQIENFEQEQQELNTSANKQKEQLRQKQEELSTVEQEIADVGGDEVKQLKEQIDELRTEEIKTTERINYANEEIKELTSELTTYKERIQHIETELDTLNKDLEDTNEQITDITEHLESKEKTLKELKQRIASSDDTSIDLSKQLTLLTEQYNEKNSAIHEQQLLIQRTSDQLETLSNQISELQESKETYSFEIKDITWQITELQKEQTSTTKERRKIESSLFENKKQESELTAQLQDIDRSIRRMEQEKAKLQAEFDAASSVHQRYNRAVTEVLKARDSRKLKGIHGTIAELAHVEDSYKTAMGIAAGARMQSIVVDDDEAASQAIRFLQQRKLGRATFLPLNKMISGKPRGKALMVVKEESSLGFAIDLVKFPEEYRGAFWYVFGDTIVVDTLENARKMMGGVRLVDLGGSLIEASGAMRGGSTPKTTIMFSDTDRSKLESLHTELKKLIALQEHTEEELNTVRKTLSTLEEQLAAYSHDQSTHPPLHQLQSQEKEYTQKLEKTLKLIDEKTQEKETIQQSYDEITQTIKTLNEELIQIQQEKQEKGTELLKGSKKEDAQQSRDLSDSIETLRTNHTQLITEQQGTMKKIEVLTQRNEELNDHINTITTSITKYKDEIEELMIKRTEYQGQIKTLTHVQDTMSDKIQSYAKKRDTIQTSLTTIEHQLDTINTRIESYYDLISRAQSRLPTLEETLNDLNEELKLYNVSVDTEHLPPVESLKDSQRTIEETMRELEPVNMRALEEYSHQQQRKTKLDEDVNHLKNQRKNLIKLAKEITNKKTERFMKVYKEIDRNFQMMYAKLSEGGEAELKLENPDELFTSGLTIKARPRGKKVLLLSALSGGEKSIASLAFIFAIQHYDPSPFYVLDEIDMFLDGVNAETVSRMVKQNALDNQFIMVSLRKITLKEANHVYGVTMQDDGVSDMIGNIDPDAVGPEGEIQTLIKGVQ